MAARPAGDLVAKSTSTPQLPGFLQPPRISKIQLLTSTSSNYKYIHTSCRFPYDLVINTGPATRYQTTFQPPNPFALSDPLLSLSELATHKQTTTIKAKRLASHNEVQVIVGIFVLS